MDDPDDRDSLRNAYDLDAWAPPAAPDVTAAVLARMGEPVARGALSTMVEHGPARSSRRRWALAGIGFTATAIGALVTYLLMRDTGPGSGEGAVATATPTRLDLGASSAQLEANTELVWRRDGHALFIDQSSGTSTWTLGPDETIEIKAGGAKGAAAGGNDQVAVRATGASLRVEVDMNLSDAKVIGASAVAASAVAAITIVVYEGEARVTSAGQTVEMRAGGTLEARADRPPVQRDLVAGAPVADDPDLADRKKLQAAIDKLRGDLETCTNGTASSPTAAELVLDVATDGGTEIARLNFTPKAPEAAELCVNEHVLGRRLDATRLGGRFRVAFRLTKRCDADALRRAADRASDASRMSDASDYRAAADACASAPSCDFAALSAEGESALGRGDYKDALVAYDAALACRPGDLGTIKRAFLAACNAPDEGRAVALWKEHLQHASQGSQYAQICTRNGIRLPSPDVTVADVTPSKDPDIQAARVALADGEWDTAIDAAQKAMARNHPEAKDLYDKAHLGSRAEAARRNMEDALRRGDFTTAASQLTVAKRWPKVGQVAEKQFIEQTGREVARVVMTAKSRALTDDTCASFRSYMATVSASYPENMFERVRAGAGTCKPGPRAGSTPEAGSAKTTTKSPKPPECAPERVKENKTKVDAAISRGAYAEALMMADKVLACGFDGDMAKRGFLAACNARDAGAARRYFAMVKTTPNAEQYAQICLRNGIPLDKP